MHGKIFNQWKVAYACNVTPPAVTAQLMSAPSSLSIVLSRRCPGVPTPWCVTDNWTIRSLDPDKRQMEINWYREDHRYQQMRMEDYHCGVNPSVFKIWELQYYNKKVWCQMMRHYPDPGIVTGWGSRALHTSLSLSQIDICIVLVKHFS